jgi:uncharacterized protein
MRVNIDEIKEVGLQRDWDLTREFVDEIVREDNAGYRSRATAHVAAHLMMVDRRVFLKAHSQASLTAPCSRCLTPVSIDVPVDFTLTFVPKDRGARPDVGPGEEDARGHSHASFAPDSADEETFAGKTIDLDPVVREQILLALPSYPVCRESCKGLCSVCGTNLNERECACDRRVPDPRWAALEKFKAKSNE